MSTLDARKHRVPEGTDPASRQSLLDLSLSIPSVATAGSLTEANQHVQALARSGITATQPAPIHVWRYDLGSLTVWDGSAWQLPRDVLVKAPGVTIPRDARLIIATGTKVVTTNGNGKAVLDYGYEFRYVISTIITSGDNISAPLVTKGQWGNNRGCDVFAYSAAGALLKNTRIRVNYIIAGW